MKQPNLIKGKEYIKILHSIRKITQSSQIEPTRKLIDLFGKKPENSKLKDELMDHLLEKSKSFNYPEDELLNLFHKKTCGFQD